MLGRLIKYELVDDPDMVLRVMSITSDQDPGLEHIHGLIDESTNTEYIKTRDNKYLISFNRMFKIETETVICSIL